MVYACLYDPFMRTDAVFLVMLGTSSFPSRHEVFCGFRIHLVLSCVPVMTKNMVSGGFRPSKRPANAKSAINKGTML